MNLLQVIIASLGRFCLSAIFILSVIAKLMNWHETEQMVFTQMNSLLSLLQGQEGTCEILLSAVPWSKELLSCAAALELVGGVLIFAGYRVRLGAVLLILFLIPTTLLFHHYWLLQGAERELQMIMFLKNLSIFGGLLIVLAFGTGKYPPKVLAKAPPK